MFRASSCPSSGAYKLQQQPLVYCRNVVVAVLLVVVGPTGLLRQIILESKDITLGLNAKFFLSL